MLFLIFRLVATDGETTTTLNRKLRKLYWQDGRGRGIARLRRRLPQSGRWCEPGPDTTKKWAMDCPRSGAGSNTTHVLDSTDDHQEHKVTPIQYSLLVRRQVTFSASSQPKPREKQRRCNTS